MSRPYLTYRIEALEQLYLDGQENADILRGLEDELDFRTTKRAIRLRENVQQRLGQLSKPQKQPELKPLQAPESGGSGELKPEPEVWSAPEWDCEQLAVIRDEIGSWQLVTAGPGAGKSAIACQRIAYLVDSGVTPSRILLISFTRTAVAELRDRIVSYAVAGEEARQVRITTIDSNAWSLRVGFDDEPLTVLISDESYDVSIRRATQLIRDCNPNLMEYLERLEHLIIDEAQDVVGPRTQFVLELLGALREECGVTIMADPNQAIYGFTSDEDETGHGLACLLDLLKTNSPKPFKARSLLRNHRIKSAPLRDVFDQSRKEVERHRAPDPVGRVKEAIRQTSGQDLGLSPYETLAERLKALNCGSSRVLALFRRRGDVLMASGFLSQAGVEHRLRMSGLPTVVKPWIGWLFNSRSEEIVSKSDFSTLWARQLTLAPAPFEGISQEAAWEVLHRMAAARRAGCLDLAQLRVLVARPRPPIELCEPELGCRGPILGTIHASKGREADTVVLLLPSQELSTAQPDQVALREEGRVYYVGATRARRILFVATNISTPVSYLDSGRIYRLRRNRVQMEVGRVDDVDRLAHLSWDSASIVQLALANSAGRTHPALGRLLPGQRQVIRIVLDTLDGPIEVGEMSRSFYSDLKKAKLRLDGGDKLKSPREIQYLNLAAVTTVGLTEAQRCAVGPPFSQSGFALAPVVRGYPTIPFFRRGAQSQ